MSAYRRDRRQLRIPNVPKSDGRTPRNEAVCPAARNHLPPSPPFPRALSSPPEKELRKRPGKRNDLSRPRVSPRGISLAELTADDKSDDQGGRNSLSLSHTHVRARTSSSNPPFEAISATSRSARREIFLSFLLVDLSPPLRGVHPVTLGWSLLLVRPTCLLEAVLLPPSLPLLHGPADTRRLNAATPRAVIFATPTKSRDCFFPDGSPGNRTLLLNTHTISKSAPFLSIPIAGRLLIADLVGGR